MTARRTEQRPNDLRREAWSDTMIWNAVVADDAGIFVSGPRWAGGAGPQVARVDGGAAHPFPDAEWNSWRDGDDPSNRFVNVNSLHTDDAGGMWVVDTGSPIFGGDPLPGGAKIVHVDLSSGNVTRIIPFAPDIAKPGSYVDDIRLHGDNGYLTDAGNPGIIVLDMRTGVARRVLEGHPSTIARDDRLAILEGKVLRGPNGNPLKVHCDPMELSPDGAWLLYGPLHGPWSRVPTDILDDASLSPEQVAAAVEPFADIPPVGGTAIDAEGNLYFSDLKDDAIRKRAPDGTVTTLVQDPRLHWVDAMFISADNRLWMPAAQMDRVPLFQSSQSKVQRPIGLYSISLQQEPER